MIQSIKVGSESVSAILRSSRGLGEVVAYVQRPPAREGLGILRTTRYSKNQYYAYRIVFYKSHV